MNTFLRLEQCLLPPPETIHWNGGNLLIEQCTTTQKVAHCAKNFFTFAGLVLISPATLTYDWFATKEVVPAQKTSDITAPAPAWPPLQRGFASSLFQTSGLGTKYAAAPELRGKCDWDKWMTPKHITAPAGFEYKEFFTDILSDPTVYIEMLKAQNVTAERFSLEWAVIEPEPGVIDMKAVALYNNFIEKLLEAGITPFVTLSHFVLPEWFYESGSFQKMENVDLYVNFALKAMELFPQVKDWWSFNELGVKAFQQTREAYPTDVPEGSSLSKRVYAAGISTRNMLIAHCKLHQEVAKRFPDNKVGVTHQWLTFDTANGNWLENLFSYLFTKFGFTPVYQFFKDGKYSFQFPFMANIRFEIPKEEFDANDHFLKRLGVQAYPKAMFKMGLNHGKTYPGLPSAIKNLPFFSFGSTCEPGGTVMRFGPRWKAEEMDKILDQAFAISSHVFFSEYGSDAKIQRWDTPDFVHDDAAQADYLQQLTERIQNYSAKTLRTIEGLFFWTNLRRQMEWAQDNGKDCELGIIETIVDKDRRMVGWEKTPASEYLAKVFAQGAVPERTKACG